jgi:hypothetical protein
MIVPQRILVLYRHYNTPRKMRAAVCAHLRALDSSEVKHDILYYNAAFGAPAWLRHLHFDAVILHNTFLGMRWLPLFQVWKRSLRWVQDLDCVKIAIPQDEYDHSEILDEWLYEWGVSTVFTNFDEFYRQVLYPIMHDKADFHECFTGYIDGSTAEQYRGKLLPSEERPNDIVYRAGHLPYWFGSHGQLKHRIADVVAERAQAHGLKYDISTRSEDAIIGDRWLDFLASGKAVLGCESGSSALDRRGEIQAQIKAMLREDPEVSFAELSARLPAGWDDYRFFAIGPRHFEAVITKTCQILVEGQYSSILEADKHYIPLRRDFSNLDEVLEKVRDDQYVRDMVERAYDDIYLSGKYTYRELATGIEMALSKRQAHGRHPTGSPSQVVWRLGHMVGRVADCAATEMAAVGYDFLHLLRKLGLGL